MPFSFLSTHAFLILFFWGHIYHVAKCSRIKTTVSFTPSETMMMILKSAVTDMKNLVLGSAPMHIRPYKKCMRCMKTMPESSIQFQLFYSFFFLLLLLRSAWLIVEEVKVHCLLVALLLFRFMRSKLSRPFSDMFLALHFAII